MKIPLTRPWADERELEALREVLHSGWWTQGPRVTEFENSVLGYVGAQAAVATSSCTTALHIALLLLDVKPGDEVIVPSYTWITTANVVRMVGAVPVFADIDPATFNIDPLDIEHRVGPRTKGMIPVHQFGLPADLDALANIAKKHSLWMVEDAACALGSVYKGSRIGSHSEIVCFSFHPRKLISTGEGGMICFNGSTYASQARSLVSHGAPSFETLGYNYRLSDLQAAVGIAQMKKIDEIIARRAARAARYTAAFKDIPYLTTSQLPSDVTPNWQSYVLRLSGARGVSVGALAERLSAQGIACRPGYMACHLEPLYRTLYPELFLPNTEQALRDVLILPIYPQMTDDEQDDVVHTLKEALG